MQHDGVLLFAQINPNCDVTPASVPVYRVGRPGARSDPLLPPDLEGAWIDRVVTPSPDLLRYPLNNEHVR